MKIKLKSTKKTQLLRRGQEVIFDVYEQDLYIYFDLENFKVKVDLRYRDLMDFFYEFYSGKEVLEGWIFVKVIKDKDEKNKSL